MPSCRSAAAVAAIVLGILAGTPVATASDAHKPRTVFSFTDADISESSGLVDAGSVMYTINDSGHGAQVYVVDKRTGNTVATSTYSSNGVTDVEAIAPGRRGDVWVGDVGDNRGDRSTVAVYHVPARKGRLPERVDAPKFDLVYPDGPHDAETLLVDPRTGRLFVVSKAILGGTVYRAPARLDAHRPNQLTAVAPASSVVTDGSFFPDGRHVILRNYGSASVYTFPGFRRLGSMSLPRQRQGEGIAVGATGCIYLSSEGPFSAVKQVFLKPALVRAMGGRGPSTASTRPTATPSYPSARQKPASDPLTTGDGNGIWVALGVLAVSAAGWLYFTFFRRRSRRRQ